MSDCIYIILHRENSNTELGEQENNTVLKELRFLLFLNLRGHPLQLRSVSLKILIQTYNDYYSSQDQVLLIPSNPYFMKTLVHGCMKQYSAGFFTQSGKMRRQKMKGKVKFQQSIYAFDVAQACRAPVEKEAERLLFCNISLNDSLILADYMYVHMFRSIFFLAFSRHFQYLFKEV